MKFSKYKIIWFTEYLGKQLKEKGKSKPAIVDGALSRVFE
jgi:hypothetical protein